MSTKFSLQPKPTFKATVKIPRPGDADGELTFTFKHRKLDEVRELLKSEAVPDVQFITEIADGWALPEEFSRENIDVLMQNYPAAMKAITATYYNELLGNREKN